MRTADHDVRCDERRLWLLRPLDEMAVTTRRAVTRWLWAHGITPADVAVGLPIERDGVLNGITWRERGAGGAVVRRWRYEPTLETGWPAPFPDVLREAAAGTGADAAAEAVRPAGRARTTSGTRSD